jgi:hypothetical protein
MKPTHKFPESDFKPTPFLQAAFQMVSETLVATKSIPPLLILAVDKEEHEKQPDDESDLKGLFITEFPGEMLNSGDGKDKLAEMLKDMLKTRPSKEAVFVTEIWTSKPDTPEDIMKLILERKIMPAQLPNKYRAEGIMLQYYDLSVTPAKNYFGKAIFSRDADGNVVLVEDPEYLDVGEQLTRTEGRFANLAS